MIKVKEFLLLSARVSILSAIAASTFGLALAWTGPTVAPPGGNTNAPITTGATGQSKTGYLNLANPNTPGYPLSVGAAGGNWSGVFNWPPASAPASSYGILVGSSASGYSEFENASSYYSLVAYNSYGLYTNGAVYAAGGFSGGVSGSGSFGGGFELNSGGACYVANGVTGGCSCPGYAPNARYSYYMDTNSTYGGGRGYVCSGS